MVRVADLCHSCIYFDPYNYECELNHYLEGESDMFTVECEDYEAKEDEI